jgi:hypothetical protein
MLDKPKLNGLTTETTKIELANSYLEKAYAADFIGYYELDTDTMLSLSECIYLVTDVFDVSHEQRRELYDNLPPMLKRDVIVVGVDTIVRENICKWYKEYLNTKNG